MGMNFFIMPNAKNIEDKYELLRIEKVHIGKSSYGWQFLFNHNNWKYFDRDKDSFAKFFDDGIIIDEDGQVWDDKDFWRMVHSKSDGLNHEKAIKEGAILLPYRMDPEMYYFGFRFSGSTNFS